MTTPDYKVELGPGIDGAQCTADEAWKEFVLLCGFPGFALQNIPLHGMVRMCHGGECTGCPVTQLTVPDKKTMLTVKAIQDIYGAEAAGSVA